MNDYTQYKDALDAELATLLVELNKLGVVDPRNAENWDLKKSEIDVLQADQNEAADSTEEAHIESIVLKELGARYRNVIRAQKKLEDDTYGICEVCNEPIEELRLIANAAARTCKKHLSEEDALAL